MTKAEGQNISECLHLRGGEPHCEDFSEMQIVVNMFVHHHVFNLSNIVPVKMFHFFLFTCLSPLLDYELFMGWVMSYIHLSVTSTSSYT